MRLVRLAAALTAVLSVASTANAGPAPPPDNPTRLKPFLLRVTETPARTFARTPSFAWSPVRNAAFYELELATSPGFSDGAVVWSSNTLRSPAASIPLALPWLTGNPYGYWARVRALSPTGAASDWSTPYGFNMSWSSPEWRRSPKLSPVDTPGLVQWKPVDGATAYDVWWVDVGKVIRTRTNAADEREFFTFHQDAVWTQTVRWRVRAVRKTYGRLPNFLPAVSYGPWSAVQTSTNPAFMRGPLTTLSARSDKTSTETAIAGHRLTPGFLFGGDESLGGKPAELYRVYVFSDAECVNVVFKGGLVGSPAYAPRTTGSLAFPANSADLELARNGYLRDGLEGTTYMADRSLVKATESEDPYTNEPDEGAPDPDEGTVLPPPEATDRLPSTPRETGAPVDLWDSGYPNGRYYWTVVPVEPRTIPKITTYLAAPAAAGASTITVNSTVGFVQGQQVTIGTGSTMELLEIATLTATTMRFTTHLRFAHDARAPVASESTSLEYVDLDLPQDACDEGRVQSFGKVNEPVVTGATSPYVTGLDSRGRLVRALGRKQQLYGTPLAAWAPALGADQYQIQWSPSRYPWRPVDPVSQKRLEKLTYATAAILDRPGPNGATTRVPLAPGRWYYRVRGIDFALPGTARAMSWSDVVEVRIAKPKFAVAGR